MASEFQDPRAEAFMRRAVLNAEFRGEDVVAALKIARKAVENGEHLRSAALVDDAVRKAVRRLVRFLGRCYDEEITVEVEGESLSAEQAWSDLQYVFGGGSDDDDTYDAILEFIEKAAGR